MLKCLFILLIFIVFSGSLWGAEEKDPLDESLQRLNKRYEGYFLHQRDAKRWDQRRLSGLSALKKEREKKKQKRERARRSFRRNPEKNWEALEKKWEAKQSNEQLRRKKLRKNYVRQQSQIEKVKERAKKIPPMKELGLDSETEENRRE